LPLGIVFFATSFAASIALFGLVPSHPTVSPEVLVNPVASEGRYVLLETDGDVSIVREGDAIRGDIVGAVYFLPYVRKTTHFLVTDENYVGCHLYATVVKDDGEYHEANTQDLDRIWQIIVASFPAIKVDSQVVSPVDLVPNGEIRQVRWIGIALNGMLVATVILFPLCLLWLVTTAAIRYFRYRTGRCLSCGYMQRGIESMRCPECGNKTERDGGVLS
jgi:hypothetical protein